MQRIWQVQVKKDSFEAVYADDLEVSGGTLVFKDRGKLVLAMAPGEWMTVHDDGEARERLARSAKKKIV